MTHNQIEYWKLRETQRSNRVNEGETKRHNIAGEAETNRSNIAHEVISAGTLAENTRHNKASENENFRHNAATENETTRSNRAREYETWRSNVVREELDKSKQDIDKAHYERSDANQEKLTDIKNWSSLLGGLGDLAGAVNTTAKTAGLLGQAAGSAIGGRAIIGGLAKGFSGLPIIIDKLMPDLITPNSTGYRPNSQKMY